MADRAALDDVVARATTVAGAVFGPGVAVREATIVAERARSLIVRCALAPHPVAPRAVIAKVQTGDDARGFSEWASLAFLASLEGAEGVAPRFHGGDADARLIVMEDLGEARTLADVLATGDAAASEAAARSLAEPMARLVAATAGAERAGRYAQLRAGLPGGEGTGRRAEAERWRAAWPRVAAWFAALDCPTGAGFEAAFARVADTYAEPGAFLALSHGDPAPSNNHTGPAARLLDFEYGAYRHALYDITGWYVLCPLPERWVAGLHDAFRQRLAGVWSPLDDDPAYRAAWGAICAFRALAMLTWLPREIVTADRPWAEGWTTRGALLTAATRLGRATAGVPALAALHEAGERLAGAARARWPELGAGLPQWPGGAQ